jgi:hypothetical protein
MPNTPDRQKPQPGSSEERKRQQLKDRSLEETDDDTEEGRIEAPGEEDDEVTPLRTEEGAETGEDEDLPDDASTQVNSNPGNLRKDRGKAGDAGRKGGQRQ